MNKTLLFPALALVAMAGASAQAQSHEVGRVLSSTPVIQQVAVPRQVCSNQQVVVQQPNSGAGSVMGAIAGGAMGNAIGDGTGRAAATVIGLIGGALVGNRIEGSGNQVQNVQQCSTQTYYENRAVAYNVTYEYAGRQYTVQMPQDPGPTIRLQVTPLGANTGGPADETGYGAAPGYGGQQWTGQPVYADQGVQTVMAVPAPVVVYPAPYYRPYYAPIGLSLNFGYSRGHHRHHWR